MPRSTRGWIMLITPLAIILLYVLIASYKLRFPGTMYDEALYVNSALGGVDKITFFTKSLHGIPILLMPYIGALKAYIFFPIFGLFGVSPITMRLPDVLITAGALYIMYKLVREQAGYFLSICVLLITAFNASFIMFTRLDNGPVVLDFLLKILALFSLLYFIKTYKLLYLSLFWLFMFLGEFNKLNFLWYVNAFTAAAVLIYGLSIWKDVKKPKRIKVIAISVAGYVACIAYYLYINISMHLGSSFGFVGWNTIYIVLAPVVDGSWFYNYALSPNNLSSPIIFWAQVVVIFLGTAIIGWRIYKNRTDFQSYKFYLLITLSLLLLLVQLSVTKQATAGWHYFSIFPLLGIVFILALSQIVRAFLNKAAMLGSIIIGLVVIIFCIHQLYVYGRYASLYGKTPSNLIWSNAIYDLSQYTKQHKDAKFISMDWGTQTQLIGFDPVKSKYYEAFGPIAVNNSLLSQDTFQQYISTKSNAYYITHTNNALVMKEQSRDFLRLAEYHGYEPVIVKEIDDGSTPVFDIYRLNK